MAVLPQQAAWTSAQYLEFERKQDVRHEYLRGQVYAMAGASERRNQLASALNYLLCCNLLLSEVYRHIDFGDIE